MQLHRCQSAKLFTRLIFSGILVAYGGRHVSI